MRSRLRMAFGCFAFGCRHSRGNIRYTAAIIRGLRPSCRQQRYPFAIVFLLLTHINVDSTGIRRDTPPVGKVVGGRYLVHAPIPVAMKNSQEFPHPAIGLGMKYSGLLRADRVRFGDHDTEERKLHAVNLAYVLEVHMAA